MNHLSISRRRFAQLLTAGAAGAVTHPSLALAAPSIADAIAPNAVVRLSANENPYGPSPKALQAMTDGFKLAWKYPVEHADLLVEALAKTNGVGADQILIGAGSGEILSLCATAFTGPLEHSRHGRGSLIAADPTFESILGAASVRGAEVVKIPLTPDYGHDLAKMAAAANEGLVYICNPNNPTASITPKDQLRDFIASAPARTMILVDEAYFHYADSSAYESVIPLVKDRPNLVVARTFSKIYGMAGLRCGYCVAQPSAIARMQPHLLSHSVNIMALVAALASLEDPEHVARGRRLNSETKAFVRRELDAMGYEQIPSAANFIMVDLKRPVAPLITAMRERRVQVGRLFPTLPNHLRVTIGKKAEMEAFLAAFREVAVAS